LKNPVRALVIAEAIHQLGFDEFLTKTGSTVAEADTLQAKAKKA
jgi:hypothetical protein